VAAACAFCALLAGERPARFVYRGDEFCAFLDTRPVFPGHVLIAPRLHIERFDQLPPELGAPLVAIVQRVQRAVEQAMSADGSLHIVNNTVSQSVPHLHYHVIPRRFRDGLRFWLGPRTRYGSDAEADDVAGRIAALIDAA
jgi:histidine triad (HIT) family protein